LFYINHLTLSFLIVFTESREFHNLSALVDTGFSYFP